MVAVDDSGCSTVLFAAAKLQQSSKWKDNSSRHCSLFSITTEAIENPVGVAPVHCFAPSQSPPVPPFRFAVNKTSHHNKEQYCLHASEENKIFSPV